MDDDGNEVSIAPAGRHDRPLKSGYWFIRKRYREEVQEAIEAPRFSSVHFPSSFFPHHATPGGLRVEGRIPAAVRDALGARGHTIEVEDDWVAGDVLCIRVDAARGVLRAGADPRGEVSGRMPSYAIAW